METQTKVPSEKDIQRVAQQLSEMKQARDQARDHFLAQFKSEEFLGSLGKEELIGLVKRIQVKLRGTRRANRGTPVPPELRESLLAAIKQDNYSLSQMHQMFGLSISYISRVKGELRKAGQIQDKVLNAYEDRALVSHAA